MISPLDIPVIIPSYEPDERLVQLIEELFKRNVKHIVVVNDGSGPASEKVFEQAAGHDGCIVLRHAVNLGKGRALKTAFNYCLQTFPQTPGCVTADSDGQHTPDCILSCMQKLFENPQALILGCRDFDAAGVPARSSFGNKCTRRVFQYLLGLTITDTQTGLRAIPTDFMKHLMNVKGERFEFETNMLIETKSLQLPILEIVVDTIYIEENKSSHFNPIKDSLRIYLMFGKFLFSSLSSCVLDLLLFTLFCNALRENGGISGISYIVQSTVLARVFSAIYNFFINYKVVFKSKTGIFTAAAKYCVLAICQMLCSAFLVDTLFRHFGGYELPYKIAVDTLLFLLSFVIQRELVYREKKGA